MIFPDYFRILQRTSDGWMLIGTKVFCSLDKRKYNPEDAWVQYAITKQALVIELFRQFHGKLGFYLVDLKYQRYYYCGLEEKDIQTKLISIGIGVKDIG